MSCGAIASVCMPSFCSTVLTTECTECRNQLFFYLQTKYCTTTLSLNHWVLCACLTVSHRALITNHSRQGPATERYQSSAVPALSVDQAEQQVHTSDSDTTITVQQSVAYK
jgi:hypothetical protein